MENYLTLNRNMKYLINPLNSNNSLFMFTFIIAKNIILLFDILYKGDKFMKKNFKKLIFVIIGVMLTVALTGCSAKPDATVQNFLDALKQQDVQKASGFVKDENSKKDEFKYDSPEQEKMIKAIFSKLDYKLDKTTKNGNSATVKAKITSIDLTRVTTKMVSELLPTLMSQALSDEKQDDKKQNDMIVQYMINAINDPNAPKTETDVEIKLVKDKKGWLIVPSEDLTNAMTGNFQKAAEAMSGK